uniref:Uncharacterized protein n=1 Tax=Anguilla anguilla TaxID=7936 RepID=A0A0E9QCG4_ANGAN
MLYTVSPCATSRATLSILRCSNRGP